MLERRGGWNWVLHNEAYVIIWNERNDHIQQSDVVRRNKHTGSVYYPWYHCITIPHISLARMQMVIGYQPTMPGDRLCRAASTVLDVANSLSYVDPKLMAALDELKKLNE